MLILLALALFPVFWLYASEPAEGKQIPLYGTWDVVRVEVGRRDQQHWLYKPQDPRFVGRQITIDPVAITMEDDACYQPHWQARPTTLKALVAKTFKRSPKYQLSATPTPVDFGFEHAPKSMVAYFTKCDARGSNSSWGKGWFVSTGQDEMALVYENMMVLFAKRRKATDRPVPSFPCEKAKPGAEAAICSSIRLAGWDQSVAAAWKRAVDVAEPEDLVRLQGDQRTWLSSRDKCGSNESCLVESMSLRTEALMSET